MPSTIPLRTNARLAFVAFSCALCASSAMSQVTYRLLARTGDPAPGTPNAFHAWSNPMRRAPGKVATFGNMELGFGADYNAGIWSGGLGTLGLDALAGAPLPVTAGRLVAGIDQPGQNRNQTVVFHAILDTSLGFLDDRALFVGTPGAISLLAQENNVAPSTGGALFDFFQNDPAINDAGRVAFIGNIRGAGVPAGTNRVIYAGTPGALDLVVRSGDPVPGFPAAAFGGLSSPVINSAGAVAFGAELNAAPFNGIWVRPASGALSTVVVRGDPAPGFPAGWTFPFGAGGSSSVVRMNDQGQFAFSTIASNGSNNQYGLWTGTPGAFTLRVKSFDPAPGSTPTALFDTLGNVIFNRGGSAIFNATLMNSPANNTGIWMHTPGVGVRVVSLINEHAPDMAPGVFITSYTTSLTGNNASHALNNRGETLFYGVLNFVVNSTVAHGVFAGRPGRVHKVMASGDVIEVAPGVFRTVITPYVWTGDSPDTGRNISINDRGEVAFMVSFVGGEFALMLAQLPNPCPGDASGDDVIDFIDLNIILSQFGGVGPGLSGDLNGDGVVDFLDLNAVLSYFGGAC